MPDTLNIYGVTYSGVTGIKAYDNNNNVQTFARPQGTKTITENGTGIDVAAFATADVNVSGGSASLGTKIITANGQYDASDDGYDGYSEIDVNVPNTYSASDEGKVVSNGALVAQTSTNITQDGTYDTTLNDEVVVNVSGGSGYASGSFTPATLTGNATLNTGLATVHAFLIIPEEALDVTSSTYKLYSVWGENPDTASYIKLFAARRNSSGRSFELWVSATPPFTISNGEIDISFQYPNNTGYFDTKTYKWYAW